MKEMLEKYVTEYNGLINQMELIRKKIQELNREGENTTANANVLRGKIELLHEMIKKEDEGAKKKSEV